MLSIDWSTLQGTCRFSDGEQSLEIDPTIPQSTDRLSLDFQVTPCALGHRVMLTLTPKQPLTLDTLMFTLACPEVNDAKIFVNGYQSWTDSFERSSTQRLPALTPLAKLATRKYHVEAYADSTWMRHPSGPGRFYGYTYAVLRWGDTHRLIGSLSEDNGFTIIDVLVPQHILRIRKDLHGIQITAPLMVEWVILDGERNPVFDTYFDLQGLTPPSLPPRSGWTSWYHYYQAISEPIILRNLDAFSTLHPQPGIFQIDDGYQTSVGDWLSVDRTKFPQGMKPIATAIHEKGHLAGLWLAPFVAERNSAVYRDHPQWFLKDKHGQAVCAGGNWSGAYALDLENPEVIAYLTHVFDTVLKDWGYDLVKLDFLYAACMGDHPTKSRGQRMGEAMRFLRQIVGDKLILGCGVPLGSAFGRVDYCRIGPDVGLDWTGPWFHRYIHRERVSTQTAIRNALGRSPLNQRAFLNDPDVFLLRDEGVQLSMAQRELLTRVNALTGSLLFTSDDVSAYDDAKRALFRLATACEPTTIDSVDDQNGVFIVNFTRQGQRLTAWINATDQPITTHSMTLPPYHYLESTPKESA
jgi:alpha-galactosidase